MKRALRSVAVLLLLAGCEQRVAEAERKAEAEEKAAERYEAVDVRGVQQRIDAQKAELDEREKGAAQAEAQLHELRKDLAQAWSGSADELQKRLASASVPAPLVRYLEAAQSSAASTTVQARYEHALEAQSFGEIEGLLYGTETDFFAGPPGAGVEPECEHESIDLKCEALPSDDAKLAPVQTCQGGGVNYLASTEDGALVVRQLQPPGHLRLVRALTRDWWMVRREHPTPITARSADRGDEVKAMAWVGFLQLGSDAATERVSIAAEAKGGAVGFEPSDLDGDGTPEILVIAPDQVRAVHHERKGNDLVVWTPEETCRLLASGGSAPAARERCAEVERKAKEAEAAAARLKAAIAQAPPPAKTLEDLREALLRCDQQAALKQVSKSLLATIEKEKAKDGPEKFERDWKKLCDQIKKDEPKLRSIALKSSEVVGGIATVELAFPDNERTEKLRLVFDGSAWKLEPENLPRD
ncbi:MAG: hypothetical protein QM765_01345 [Myxococcales bacterium]